MVTPTEPPHSAETDASEDDEGWWVCWDAIANAAWPDEGATRSEVLELLLAVRPESSVTPPETGER